MTRIITLILLLPLCALAQFTTNTPGVRTNLVNVSATTNLPGSTSAGQLTFTTNSPNASWVGTTAWPPAPTFTNFAYSTPGGDVDSFTLQGLSWTKNTNLVCVPGQIEVWNANLPSGWVSAPTNWALLQTITVTNSIAGQSVAMTNASLQGYLWVRVRYAYGSYRSDFSTNHPKFISNE